MKTTPNIVIVGAGHAGASVAALLRQYGWSFSISIIGEESILPYQRPPLSKAWLKGDVNLGNLTLRPQAFYTDNDITLRLGTRVGAIDRTDRRVRLSSGETIDYEYLIIATGSKLRRLNIPGIELPQVMELRTINDADRLRPMLGPGKRLVIIGGGYVGLEVASSARKSDTQVTVIEREERLLARVAGPTLSTFVHAHHLARGVEVLLKASVEAIEETSGCVSGVRMSDGQVIYCDAVLVGVGATANDSLAHSVGIRCNDGIVVDAESRTSDPNIYAIGDCANRPIPRYSRSMRLESVPSSLEQAKQVAASICGRLPPPAEVPWFWSDQFDLRLKSAGIRCDVTETIVRGDPTSGSFAVFYLGSQSQLQAVETVNAVAEFITGKALIAKNAVIPPDKHQSSISTLRELAL